MCAELLEPQASILARFPLPLPLSHFFKDSTSRFISHLPCNIPLHQRKHLRTVTPYLACLILLIEGVVAYLAVSLGPSMGSP